MEMCAALWACVFIRMFVCTSLLQCVQLIYEEYLIFVFMLIVSCAAVPCLCD